MKSKLFITAIATLLTFGSVGFALAAPYYVFTRTLVPESNSAFDIGTSTLTYRNLYVDRICLSADCQTAWPAGGTFSWTPTSYGNATSTTLGFLNGFLSTASSTFTSNTYFPSGIWNASGKVGIGTTEPGANWMWLMETYEPALS